MIKLAVDTIDRSDINALCNWLQQDPIPQLTKGPLTEQYEKSYAKRVGRKYAVFVNSGSSANLISIYSLILSERLKNNKVVVPAISWITTISPVVQFGLQPLLCDVNMRNLAVDLDKLEKIFVEESPSLFILVPVLGLVPDMAEIVALCQRYGVILILDACEAQGSMYLAHPIESFGLMATCSSYFGHITSTIEGGMVTTDDDEMYKLLKSCRSHGWNREWQEWEKNKFNYKWKVSDIEQMYTFAVPSFNCRNTEIGAFLGLRQLEKLSNAVEKRDRNFHLFNQMIENKYWKPEIAVWDYISNLGYPVITDKRTSVLNALKENGIECRPLVSGNMGRQPFWIERYGKQELINASMIHTNGLYIPNGTHITFDDIERISKIVNKHTCG